MIIRDKIYLDINEITPYVDELCKEFTYKNPVFQTNKRLKISNKNVPFNLYHYSFNGKIFAVPRGALNKIIKFFNTRNLPLRILDQKITTPYIDISLFETTIEPHQEAAVKACIENEYGLIEAMTGSGKTISILGFISEIKKPTLILTHLEKLSDQWVYEINKRLHGNFSVGQFKTGIKKDGDIVVSVINSAYEMHRNNPDYFNKFEAVIVDEVHKVSGQMYRELINNISSKYRIGCSATIERKDGLQFLIYDIMGPVICSPQIEEVKHRVMYFEVDVVNTNIPIELPVRKRWTGIKKEEVYDPTAALTTLINNKERNTLIISKVIDLIDRGYFPIVLSDRVEHNKYLHQNLIDLGYKSILLIGGQRKKIKWGDIRDDETVDCIVSNTAISSEGLDIPRLSALVSTCPSSNSPKIIQRVGRIRRFVEGKITPLVVDIVDNLAYYVDVENKKQYILRYAAKNRLKLYKRLQDEYTQES